MRVWKFPEMTEAHAFSVNKDNAEDVDFDAASEHIVAVAGTSTATIFTLTNKSENKLTWYEKEIVCCVCVLCVCVVCVVCVCVCVCVIDMSIPFQNVSKCVYSPH